MFVSFFKRTFHVPICFDKVVAYVHQPLYWKRLFCLGGLRLREFRLLSNVFCFSRRELKWMLMTSSGCIHYSWTRLAPASFLKNTKQNSCSTKTNHPSLRLKPWRLRPELIDAFPIPVYIACSILFLNLSMSCAALVNVWKTLPQTNWKPF